MDWDQRERQLDAARAKGCKCQEDSDEYAVLDGFLEEVQEVLAEWMESLDEVEAEDSDDDDDDDESDEDIEVRVLSAPRGARMKQTARKSTGGIAPGTRLAVERGGISATFKVVGEAAPSALSATEDDPMETDSSAAEEVQRAAAEKSAAERSAKAEAKMEARAQARKARMLTAACDVAQQLGLLTSFLSARSTQLLKGRGTGGTTGASLVVEVADLWMRVVPMLTKEPKMFDGREASKGRAALGEKMRHWANALRCDKLTILAPLVQVPPQHETMQSVLLGTAQLDEPRASTELRLGWLQHAGDHAQMLALADRTSLLDWSCVALLQAGRLHDAAARLLAHDPASPVPIDTAGVYRMLTALAASKQQTDPLEYAKLTCVFAGPALLRRLTNGMPAGATSALEALIVTQAACSEAITTPSDWFNASLDATWSLTERYHHVATALLAPSADLTTVVEASALLLFKCSWGIDAILPLAMGLQQQPHAAYIVAKSLAARGCLALNAPKAASATAADTTAASKRHLEEIFKCLQSRYAPGTARPLSLTDAKLKLLGTTQSCIQLMVSSAATGAKEEVVSLLQKWGPVLRGAAKADWLAEQLVLCGGSSAAIDILKDELKASKDVGLTLVQRILSFANDEAIDAERRTALVTDLIQRATAATPSPLTLGVLQRLGEYVVSRSSSVAPGHVAAVMTAWLQKALNPPSAQPSHAYYHRPHPASSPDSASAIAALKAILKLTGQRWTYAEPALIRACAPPDCERLTASLAKQFAEELASANCLALAAHVGMRFAVASGADLNSLKFALQMASLSAVQGDTVVLQKTLGAIRRLERFSDSKVRSVLKLKPIDRPLLEMRPSFGDGAAEANKIRGAARDHARMLANALVCLVSDLHDAAQCLVKEFNAPVELANELLDMAANCRNVATATVASMQVSVQPYECKTNHGLWSSTANCAKCRPHVYSALHALEQSVTLAEMLGSRSTASKLKEACCASAKSIIIAVELRHCGGVTSQPSLIPSPPVLSASHSGNPRGAGNLATTLAALSMREIRQTLQSVHVDISGCFERRDLEELALQHPGAFDSGPSAASSGKRPAPAEPPEPPTAGAAAANKKAKSKPGSSSVVIDLGDSD